MKIQENLFESTMETQNGEVYWNLTEARRKLDFNAVQYEVELKAIERRRKILIWGLEIQIPLIIIAGIIILINGINILFGGFAMILFFGITLYLIYSTFRIVLSYLKHTGKIPTDKYTLVKEKDDVLSELARVKQAMRKVDEMLGRKNIWNSEGSGSEDTQTAAWEEEGRGLLQEISYELTFKEKRADYFYGERVK